MADDLEDLASKLRSSREGIDLVWTPEHDRLVVPEEVAALHTPIRIRRKLAAERDLSDGLRMGAVFAAVMAWSLWSAWQNSGGQWSSLYSSQVAGVAALLFLIFGLLPLYEGWKTKTHLAKMKHRDMAEDLPDAQFDSWMHRQRIPVTYGLLACLAVCAVVQLVVDMGAAGSGGLKLSILRAGLLKQEGVKYLAAFPDATETWRLMTTPFLHGNIVHLLMNAAGLMYLGRRTECLARWPHLLIVFFMAMWVGGYASFWWYPDRPAVGASGGIMGLLGFLMVFELMHRSLVPRLARRRLIAGVILMGVIGTLGMSFIDNAAHVGGLVAGMVYAAVVFPPSASMHRPKSITRDKIAGFVAGCLILVAALTAVLKMLG